jgi:hypothetical protein
MAGAAARDSATAQGRVRSNPEATNAGTAKDHARDGNEVTVIV